MGIEKKISKKNIIIIGIILLVIAGCFIACHSLMKSSPYTEEVVSKRDISTYYSFSGAISAKENQTVLADIPLQIRTVHIKEGDNVKKDAILFTLTDNQKIFSKVDGEVTSITAKEGASYMAGTTLATIINYETLQADIRIDEYDIGSVSIDKDVTVHLNALASDIEGTISRVSKEAVTEQGITYFPASVRINFQNNLRVGMSCEVTVLNQSVTDIPSISMKSLKFDNNNSAYVTIKNDKGVAVNKLVTVGINDGNYVEIKEGLVEGDIVLISTLDDLNIAVSDIT